MGSPRATALLAVVAVVMLAACADNILKERPTSRVSSTKALKPSFSATGSAQGESSVCGSYRRQLRVVQLRQLTQSGKAIAAELKAKELSLSAIIADACE